MDNSTKPTEKKQIIKKNETKVSTEFKLMGTELLYEIKTTKVMEIKQYITNGQLGKVISKKEISSVEKILKKFPLKEVTLEELTELRKSILPSFVLKKDGKYYHTVITNTTRLVASNLLNREHKCALDCKLLSAASDENGGCEKVRNFSKFIEKYDWISLGYETFNTQCDCFVVINCEHYKLSKHEQKLSTTERNKIRNSILHFVFNDQASIDRYNKRKFNRSCRED